ncbi:MAG: hypothetical protein VB021_04970 [Oscillospiraceae bacterium]|nr:hypothetical protein [Oscillospiraceae bacterium]
MKLLEMIAGFCGVFDVDLDTEFADDGYTDASGRTPVGEAFFISDVQDAQTAARPTVVLGGARRGA